MDLTLNDGTQIWLRKNTGIVESVKDWSETHISSSGGGGYLSEGTGHVSAPTVTSRSVHRQVFFVKYEDGTQKEFDTTLIGVAVGHKVTSVFGAKQGKYGHPLAFYNHTTNTHAFCGEKAYNYRDFGQRRVVGLLFAVYLIFFCLLAYGCLDSLASGPTSDVRMPVQLFWIWCFVSAGFAVYGYLRRKRFKAFYEDLTSRALAFMREQ
jgi:hypothetical protein